MRPGTALALVGFVVVLGGAIAFGVSGGGAPPETGTLTELWISDTARDNQVNHHPVGVGPDGNVVIAPVAAVPRAEEITQPSCSLVRLDRRTGSVRWRATVDPGECFTHALTRPAIADVDRDGRLEAVVATTEDVLIAYDATTGTREFSVPLPTYGYGRPTVANLTGTPGPEIVAVTIQGHVAVVDGDGTVIWRYALNNTVWATPVVGDLDADGGREVLVGTARRTVLLTAAGDVEWSTPIEATTIASGTVDDDPAVEVFATRTGAITALDATAGTVAWERSFDEIPRVHAVDDADADGRPELYASLSGQAVVALTAGTGEREWKTTLATEEAAMMPAPVVGDLDGDADPELVAVTNGGTVTVLDPDTGAELAAYERAVPVWTVPTLADLDDDGDAEILVRYGDGRVAALDYTGA